MSNRDHYPSGVPCWVDTAQPDLPAALEFYGALLGWEFAGPGPMPGDPPGEYHVARIRGRDVAGISSVPNGRAGDPGVDDARGGTERGCDGRPRAGCGCDRCRRAVRRAPGREDGRALRPSTGPCSASGRQATDRAPRSSTSRRRGR